MKYLKPLLCVAIVFIVGCSTFERDWNQNSLRPVPAGITGAWEGVWHSDSNGHTDRLRCLITKGTNDFWQAHFKADYSRWYLPFTFSYKVDLQGEESSGVLNFKGDSDLGWYAGGAYQYSGMATSTNFNSTYRCPSDYGTFQMGRPKALR
ncbi:MAG: hypothetical protein EXS24_06400 [Pedosphaera sp.]|nr:hypothetical protein [Pedosphaera sp.]